ncbi:hypothetical protein PG991_014976 [Apiospora marii]|uniref:Myb-like domain-containing protein n=2 Tax=Apiospora marii TaxID=335849 RepID=A0ABR1R3I0_9PEZI
MLAGTWSAPAARPCDSKSSSNRQRAQKGRVPRFHWNEQARCDLLLAVYKHANPSPTQWTAIIEETLQKGYPFNANAANQWTIIVEETLQKGYPFNANGLSPREWHGSTSQNAANSVKDSSLWDLNRQRARKG